MDYSETFSRLVENSFRVFLVVIQFTNILLSLKYFISIRSSHITMAINPQKIKTDVIPYVCR